MAIGPDGVDWDALAALTAAGFSSQDIYNLDQAVQSGWTTDSGVPFTSYTGGWSSGIAEKYAGYDVVGAYGQLPPTMPTGGGVDIIMEGLRNSDGTWGGLTDAIRAAAGQRPGPTAPPNIGYQTRGYNEIPELPEWARQAFYGQGIFWDQVAAGTGKAGNMPTADWEGQALDSQSRDAMAMMASELEKAGLGGLSSWAWQEMVNGAGADELMLKIQDTDIWKQRFAGNEARRQAGLPVLDPAAYLDYEREVRQLFRQYGLPEGFGDQVEDIVYYLKNDYSAPEIKERIEDAYSAINNADPVVMQVMEKYFGVRGQAWLAAWALDSSKALPALFKEAETGLVGGRGAQFGFDLARQRSEQLVEFGVNRQNAGQGFAKLAEIRPLFQETLDEAGTDLVAEEEGVDAVFNLGGEGLKGQDLVRRRQEAREAAFAGSSSGGGVRTQQGFVGLGEAR